MYNPISDTHPAADSLYVSMMRQIPISRKAVMIAEMSRTGRALALTGIRRRHPQATEIQVRRMLADQLLGPELALRVYGPKESLNGE